MIGVKPQHRALAAALAALVAVPVAAGASQTRVHEPPPPVKRPPDGATYSGTHHMMIGISGKEIQIAAWRFPCKAAKGNTSISNVALTKTSKGYKFDTDTFGIVTYSDSSTHPDQNGAIHFEGRFGRLAKTVAAHSRVKTPRCDTGRIDFSGSRQP